MKLALQDGMIRVREVTDYQYKVLRDSGRLKWDKQLKELHGPVGIETLDILAKMVTRLPEPIEKCRQQLRMEQEAVDKLRMEPEPKPLIIPQLKEGITPYAHQTRAMNMAAVVFGLADPEKITREKADEVQSKNRSTTCGSLPGRQTSGN